MRSRGLITCTLTGARPFSAVACSFLATETLPSALLNSASPLNTVSVERPSGSTTNSQSVPRIDATADGVCTLRPPGVVFDCIQLRPALRFRIVF